ncbi:MAG: tRNA 5-methoxyuridine(34)/uridine 5-oxyacetic acid(34) synthase CmoB [Gammaproteobacteria bacterium]|nr:tRNA 5-methoxyuridine(34)/uridine 5-oxyacetic acid(34) synthase CmoB [Gammaproteobacteria bacterium]
MNLDHYTHLFELNQLSNDSEWKSLLRKKIEAVFLKPSHGHFSKWQFAVDQLSTTRSSHFKFDTPIIEIGTSNDLTDQKNEIILQSLNSLHPWRKGPFNFFGTHIDTEWRCDKKWLRIQSYLPSLEGKTILDVGCGNGYYMLRMLGDGAKNVIGVDPTLVFLAQYYGLTQCINRNINAHLLPIALEELPTQINQFDYVFSMGVLYHRRNPREHLKRLHQHTSAGGSVLIETLVIDTDKNTQLIPQNRYAGMRNVWSIPSPSLVQSWLEDSGYENIQLHNIQTTQIEEQRATQWMQNYSLINFLDPIDHSKTIEGHPAPTRAIFTALRP